MLVHLQTWGPPRVRDPLPVKGGPRPPPRPPVPPSLPPPGRVRPLPPRSGPVPRPEPTEHGVSRRHHPWWRCYPFPEARRGPPPGPGHLTWSRRAGTVTTAPPTRTPVSSGAGPVHRCAGRRSVVHRPTRSPSSAEVVPP